jgi:signal transduction histidine kinase/transcriptional regulator with GAF, ATPase, and Fis domain
MDARTHTSALEESTIIERIARIVSSVRGTKPDYTRLAAELEPAVPFDIFGIVLLRHDRQAVRVTVCERENDIWVAHLHQHPLNDAMLEHVLQLRPLLVRDYADGLDGPPATSGYALSSYHQLRSTLIAPLMVENRVLGTLELGSTALHTYADHNLQRLVDAVVRVLSAAIESVQLGGNAAIQDRQRQALKDVTNALTSKVDLATVLEQIVSGVSKALNVASFIVLLDRNDYRYRLRLETQCGLEKDLLEHILQRDSGMSEKSIFWQTLKRRQPLFSQDIAADEHYPDSHNLSSELGLRSLYCYPLTTGTTAYGALVLCSTETGGFTPLKADILALFANQAAVAIHNDMLLTSVNQRRRFQASVERLDQMQQVVTDHISPEQERLEFELFKQVREETQRTFGLSFSSLMNWVNEHLLTQSERERESIRNAIQNEQVLGLLKFPIEAEHLAASPLLLRDKTLDIDGEAPFGATQDVLAQTAASALTTAAMLGELDRLITHLKLSTNWVKDAWFVVDLNGYCLYMNPAARQLCELNLEELSADYYHHLLVSSLAQGQAVGPSIVEVFAKLIPRMRNANDVRRYLQDFTQDSMYRQELRCVLTDEHVAKYYQYQSSTDGSAVNDDGITSEHHYQFTRYLLYTQTGQLEAIALQVQDVTEQVRDEKNRSALLSAFSHDLRTPLTTIKAAVTGLLEPDFHWTADDQREMLEDIDSEADHLNVLVNALIELSRIEMGAMEVKREWCDISEIFYGALPKLKRALAHRQLLPQIQVPLPLVYVDHARLAQVIFNLVENASRHSPDGTQICLVIDIIPDGSELLRVQVIDHGIKVLAHECERIFTSFQKEQSYGNGLALATCKGIIEAHQGRIWAQGVEGAGSCFAFTLPIHPQSGAYRSVKRPVELTGNDVSGAI